MKRYKLIDNRTGKITEYGKLEWDFAWYAVFIIGLLIGIFLTKGGIF